MSRFIVIWQKKTLCLNFVNRSTTATGILSSIVFSRVTIWLFTAFSKLYLCKLLGRCVPISTWTANVHQRQKTTCSNRPICRSLLFIMKTVTMAAYYPIRHRQVVLLSSSHTNKDVSNDPKQKPTLILNYPCTCITLEKKSSIELIKLWNLLHWKCVNTSYCARNTQRKEYAPTSSYRRILCCAPVSMVTKSIVTKTFGFIWRQVCKLVSLVGAFVARSKLVRNAVFAQKLFVPSIRFEKKIATTDSCTNDLPFFTHFSLSHYVRTADMHSCIFFM